MKGKGGAIYTTLSLCLVCETKKECLKILTSGVGIRPQPLHCWAFRHSLGFEDEDLGISPGWWAATVATYCPSRPGEHPKFLSLKPCE